MLKLYIAKNLLTGASECETAPAPAAPAASSRSRTNSSSTGLPNDALVLHRPRGSQDQTHAQEYTRTAGAVSAIGVNVQVEDAAAP
jgi:hypothetical protein